MTTKLTPIQISTIESALDYEHGTVRAYSGRNMYGKSCLGIVSDDPVKCLLVLALNLMDMDERDTLAMLVDTYNRQDSMGRSSSVIYFPNLAMDDPDEDDMDDEMDDDE